MSQTSETRYIVIAPTSSVTPDQITRFIHAMAVDIQIKETCFGVIIQGNPEVVAKVLAEVRKLDPNRLFSKVRGYPIGDGRRCRAEHGSRPGFTQLEKEWKDLPMFEAGLVCAETNGKVCEVPKRKKIPVSELRKICDEVCQQ
jgi:putative methanogenesis marker protein 6